MDTIRKAIRQAEVVQVNLTTNDGDVAVVDLAKLQTAKLIRGKRALLSWSYDNDEKVLTFFQPSSLDSFSDEDRKKIEQIIS